MFTVGQALILGLASSIYVVGAGILLGGRSALQAALRGGRRGPLDGTGGQVVRVETTEGQPAYFVPDFRGRPSSLRARATGPARSRGPANQGPAKETPAPRGRAHRGAAGAAGAPLATPICLN